jgi:hypothetical protein
MEKNVGEMSIPELKAFFAERGINYKALGGRNLNSMRNVARNWLKSSGAAGGSSAPVAPTPVAPAPVAPSPSASMGAAGGVGGEAGGGEAGATAALRVKNALVKSSRAPLNVLVLGEQHEDIGCILSNIKLVQAFAKDCATLIVASEGTETHPCIKTIGKSQEAYNTILKITEYEKGRQFGADRSILTLFLDAELALDIARNPTPILHPGTGLPITIDWFKPHKYDKESKQGYGPFFKTVGAIGELDTFFVKAVTEKKYDEALAILQTLTAKTVAWLQTPHDGFSFSREVVPLLQQASSTNFSRPTLNAIFKFYNDKRDIEFAEKLITVALENPDRTHLLTIRGDLHVRPLVEALRSVPWIVIDPNSKTYTGLGGGRRRGRKATKQSKKGGRRTRRR